jgi:hypothetical protein
MKNIEFKRRLLGTGGRTYTLGFAVFKDDCGGKGWKFFPKVGQHQPSRKYHETWEKCLPRWVGYPDSCESEVVS